jgi:hypothetical protein
VGPNVGEESLTRPCDASWRNHDQLVHAPLASPDRTISFIRTLEVHDQARAQTFLQCSPPCVEDSRRPDLCVGGDKFKRLLLRFERIQQRHYGMKLLAYTLINVREFCGA